MRMCTIQTYVNCLVHDVANCLTIDEYFDQLTNTV